MWQSSLAACSCCSCLFYWSICLYLLYLKGREISLRSLAHSPVPIIARLDSQSLGLPHGWRSLKHLLPRRVRISRMLNWKQEGWGSIPALQFGMQESCGASAPNAPTLSTVLKTPVLIGSRSDARYFLFGIWNSAGALWSFYFRSWVSSECSCEICH